MAQPQPSFSQSLLRAAIFCMAWVMVLFAFAAQWVWSTDLDWDLALGIAARDWTAWALISPFVFWLTWRFPLEKANWWKRILLYVVACAAAVVAVDLINEQLFRSRSQPLARLEQPGIERAGRKGPDRLQFRNLDREDRIVPAEAPDGPPPPPLPPAPRAPLPPRMVALMPRAKFNLPVFWVLVCLGHVIYYFRQVQERERSSLELQRRLSEAKLEALRMQLNPHFLFNALNALSALIHSNPKAADAMVSNLSDLLRSVLEAGHQQLVPLRKELEYLDRYLEIEKVRFGERLAVEKRFDPAVLNLLVPPLILQPIVENAIKHGIEEKIAGGRMVIAAKESANKLHLVVTDDGPGLNSSRKSTGTGIGLTNTRERLQELYGKDASMEIVSAPEKGCEVHLSFPARTNLTNT
jgi:signal transduction histidine kinase